jgi:predicted transposase/invertase (TIGR01784 family)
MAQPRRRTLDPKLDVVFKLLFAHPRNKKSLIALLTAVLRPKAPIADVEVLNPEVRKEDVTDKGIVLDLRVRLADGSFADVEMQAVRREGSRKRFLFYWARSYTTQLGPGTEYSELKPVIVVVFTNYRELKRKRLHSMFRLLEVKHHEEFLADEELHLIELPELRRMSEEEQKAEATLVRWARFLAARTDEELAAVAKEDEMIGEAKEVLEHLSEDPHVRDLASWREAQHALYRMEMAEARKKAEAKGLRKGKRQGLSQGEAKGKRDVLLMLLDQLDITLTEEQRGLIRSCENTELLDVWLRRAFAGGKVEDILS